MWLSARGYLRGYGGAALTAAVIAPLVWKSTLTLAIGELILLSLGFATFLMYLRVGRTTPAAAPAV